MSDFNQEAWSNKIKEASKKWFKENPDFNMGIASTTMKYFGESGEVSLPHPDLLGRSDGEYYRVPMDLWYEYHEALHNCKIDR